MKRRSVRTLVAAPLLALVSSATAAIPAQAVPIYDSCKAIHDVLPDAPDGNYTLRTGTIEVTVYCYDMAGTPREYLNLVHTGPGANFAQYTAGGAAPGTNVRTSFTKLRVNPGTLTVDIGDLTFAWSTGRLTHSGSEVTSMPYGVAMSCTGQSNGAGRIDLRGTPFIVTNAFVPGGFQASGQALVSSSKTVVQLSGGGYCGWISPAPAMYNPFNPQPGDFHLTLACAPVTDPRPAAVCARYL